MRWDQERFLARSDLQPGGQQLTPLEGGGSQLGRRVSPNGDDKHDDGAPDLSSDDSPHCSFTDEWTVPTTMCGVGQCAYFGNTAVGAG